MMASSFSPRASASLVAPKRTSRKTLRCSAVSSQPSIARTPTRRLQLLSSLSQAVELQGITAGFETFSGRVAMGATSAIFLELLDPRISILGSVSGTPDLSIEQLGALGLGAVVLASLAAAAVQLQDKGSFPLLEPVITSLTAAKRSAASISNWQVDSVVDSVVASVFTAEKLAELVGLGDLDEMLDWDQEA